ncbi:hypothetical protein OW763_16550 [Clostridium aestuarii]|uniref:Uncharacterized protein n=1 Tax=Clostridium aestuarii TaxID=338193 RepID=A0ABT4D6V4_9CLOT|nr:hypothetical protein [Clostridium aestuarii]MCY6485920.1 hypothetical protein [Clostridium aestuarii]
MANFQQLVNVAKNCPGYTPRQNQFTSMTSGSECDSCDNCKNYVSNECQANLFDSVLAGLDER